MNSRQLELSGEGCFPGLSSGRPEVPCTARQRACPPLLYRSANSLPSLFAVPGLPFRGLSARFCVGGSTGPLSRSVCYTVVEFIGLHPPSGLSLAVALTIAIYNN